MQTSGRPQWQRQTGLLGNSTIPKTSSQTRRNDSISDDTEYEQQERDSESSVNDKAETQRTSELQALERTLQKVMMERDEFRNEVQKVSHQLARERSKNRSERNGRLQVEKDLDEVQKQLAYQIHLKQFYIKKLAEARNELMRLQKYKDAEILYHQYYHNFIANVRGTVSQKKEKNPQKELEDKVEQDEQLIQTLRAEQEALCQKMAEMAAMQKDASMKEESLRKEVEEFKMAHIIQRKTKVELQVEKQNTLVNEELERIKTEQETLRQSLWREMEELKGQLSTQISHNIELSTKLEEKDKMMRVPAE